MKRFIAVFIILAVLVQAQTFSVRAADAVLELTIHGETPSWVSSLTEDTPSGGGHCLLAPAEKLSASLGAVFTKNGNQASLTKGENTLAFTAGSDSAEVNGAAKKTKVASRMISGVLYIPVEFCASELNYHALSTRAGRNIRIVSKTGVTFPAEQKKSGMAELESTVHRNVPKRFKKSNRLDDLIYSREDWSGAIPQKKKGKMPTGPVIFTYRQFADGWLNYDCSSQDWVKKWCETSKVNIDTGIVMNVDMEGYNIGVGEGSLIPFREAVRIKIKEAEYSNDKSYVFNQKLPTPSKDDKYMVTFYARLIDGGDADYGTGKFGMSVRGNGIPFSEYAEFGKEWKRFDFLIKDAEGANQLYFHAAKYVQTIEIGGFEIRNLGADADVSYFDNTKVDLLPAELAPDAEWRTEALERIEQVRKGDFKVIVKDKNGNAVKNANVTFDMFEHEFNFGNSMDVEYLEKYADTGEYGANQSKFINRIGPYFNTATVSNHLKWPYYYREPNMARDVMDAAKDKGLKYMRGHALWMPTNSYKEDPQEMYDLIQGDSSTVEQRYAKLKTYIRNHFREMDEKFPEIYSWDVINEAPGRTFFTDAFGKRIFKDIFQIASEEFTHGQRLAICDNRQFTEQAYWDLLDWFKEQNIKYDELTMQGHSSIGSGDTANSRRPTKFLEVWDRFAYEYKKPFAITEFSVGAYKDEYGYEGQGDFARDIMIAAFSHPACTGFSLWWLSDYWSDWSSPYNSMNSANNGRGAGVSPLFDAWFNDKPGLAQFCDLVYNKWWTKGAETVTDNSGTGSIRGFYGDYDITVRVNGQKVKTTMAAFHKGYDNVLTITLD